MNLYTYNHYKKFVNDWIEKQPKKGYGQLKKIASHLEINSVVTSQIFRGERDLSPEQALKLANYIGLSDNERDCFLLLLQRERAGTTDLKDHYTRQIEAHRKSAKVLKNSIKHHEYSDEDRATFYSHWHYSAIRLCSSIPEIKTVSDISTLLKLDRMTVSKVIDFLIKNRLVIQKPEGLVMGPSVTHVGNDSVFVNRHHLNWRLKALHAIDASSPDNLFYTGPMALSSEAANHIRNSLIQLIQSATREASGSQSEVLHCLNIDWFNF